MPNDQTITNPADKPSAPPVSNAITVARTAGRKSPGLAALEAAQKALNDAQKQVDNEEADAALQAAELAELGSGADTGPADKVARRAVVATLRLMADVQHNEGAHTNAQAKIKALIQVLTEGDN